ncbi:hypothetical protein G647_10152 [Cladophialophora carrionii CBS 160.54]|uniref:Acyl-CoA dehydrogenase n=1 Tax=Cladophialophora carrionii CBS 160.54 TaxID=1279043 RepID=V9DL40_9EURO|nr:uncharacterized protein G647_10152 [Cladophialophora carrionii CBS 160.54]ETI27053.1 hypothetical protein G647_10152 [Cladophialophora carrionii CBS 160.54]
MAHPMYRTLFGQSDLEVMPSTLPGIQFSVKRDYAGYAVHLDIRPSSDALHPNSKDLLVRAVKDGRTLDLVPTRILEGEFPVDVTTDFVHWYDAQEDCVEFRPVGEPWNSSLDNWRLTREPGQDRWRLMKGGRSLVSLHSKTSRTVGAPPIRQFASPALQAKVLPEILSGQKRISLAITEPSAGSDVRNLTTTAEKTADGKHYIVNGEKKWITNGMFSDYFSTAVRTGAPGSGAAGLSFLLIDRHLPGIQCRKIEIGAGKLSSTTYITFEDVKVPADMLIGEEGGGFKFIMSNFNHERLWITFQALRGARICLEDAFTWAQKRDVFGGKLIEQPVVRHKLGLCGKKVEALQAWVEQIVYELDHLSEKEGNRLLGGTTALLKVEAGMVAKYVADECVKIMGGLGLTKSGQGARIEAISRSVIALIVPGGSEDVMIDLGVREALKLSKLRSGARASRL